MKSFLVMLAGFGILAAPAGAAPAKMRAAEALNIEESADGWTFGRPGAPLLAEYASFGCPHCAQFAAAIFDPVDGLVKAGKLRFAWRPFLIFPHDRAAAVLTRCVAPVRRLGFIKTLMAQQDVIRTALQVADRDDTLRGKLFEAELKGPDAKAAEIAGLTGMIAMAQAHGVSPSSASACLSDASHHAWVTNADMTARLNGVTGTPTFFWKGAKVPAGTSEQLLALLPR